MSEQTLPQLQSWVESLVGGNVSIGPQSNGFTLLGGRYFYKSIKVCCNGGEENLFSLTESLKHDFEKWAGGFRDGMLFWRQVPVYYIDTLPVYGDLWMSRVDWEDTEEIRIPVNVERHVNGDFYYVIGTQKILTIYMRLAVAGFASYQHLPVVAEGAAPIVREV